MKEWKLKEAVSVGIDFRADALGYEKSPDGYDVKCGHCSGVMLPAYQPKNLTFHYLTCQHCGGVNSALGGPPEG